MIARDRRTDPNGDARPGRRAGAAGADIAAGTFLFLVLAVVYARLYFGFAFFDEAYYLALPYSFTLGYRPFLDENAIHQLGGVLVQPFVEAYLGIAGSSDGLVLFNRHLYLAAALAAAWCVGRTWAGIVGRWEGGLLAAVVVAYVPLCIFALSYNTLTCLGLLAGTALLAHACLPGSGPQNAFCATLCLATVSFAYPTMLPVAGFALAVGVSALFWTRGPRDRAAALTWAGVAGVGSVAVGGGYLLASGLPGALGPMLEFSQVQGLQGGGALKWSLLVREVQFQGRYLAVLALVLLLLVLAVSRVRSPKLATLAALCTWPALAAASSTYRDFHAPFTTVPFVLSLLGLGAPVLAFASRRRFSREQRAGLLIVTSTSVLAGLAILWSSANGLRNAALGFTPAALVTLACLARGAPASGPIPIPRSDPARDRTAAGPALLRDPRLPFAILTASLLLFQLQELWAHAYREFPPGELGATVRSGPWKGIRTTPRKIEFLARLAADLARVRDGAESILFYDYFPAGYLMTDLEPRTPGLWLFPDSPLHQGNAGLRRVYAERLRSDGRRPDLVVRLRCIPTRPPMRLQYPQHDPVSELFEPPDYETVVQRGCYSVARRLDAPRRRGSPWPPIPGSNPRARPPG